MCFETVPHPYIIYNEIETDGQRQRQEVGMGQRHIDGSREKERMVEESLI